MDQDNPYQSTADLSEPNPAPPLAAHRVFILTLTGTIAGLLLGALANEWFEKASQPSVGVAAALGLFGVGTIYGLWSARMAAGERANSERTGGNPIVMGAGITGTLLFVASLLGWGWAGGGKQHLIILALASGSLSLNSVCWFYTVMNEAGNGDRDA